MRFLLNVCLEEIHSACSGCFVPVTASPSCPLMRWKARKREKADENGRRLLSLSLSLSLSTPRDFHTPGLLSLQLLFRTNYLLWWIPLFVILEWCIVRFLNFAVISLCCVSYISTSVEYFLYSCFLWRFPCNVRSLVIFNILFFCWYFVSII